MPMRITNFVKRSSLLVIAALLGVMSFANPVSAQNPDLRYFTENGIIFYEGGFLHCDSGSATVLTGGAAGALQAQKTLDPRWVPVITAAAAKAHADPLAMASLMFWEHRQFPPYGPNRSANDSDSNGRGTWQITSSSWPPSAGPYATGVYDPLIATDAAAQIVVGKGGVAGLPLGSIEDNFTQGAKITTIAMVAKGYNAGNATWRNPGVAKWNQPGRVWMDGTKGNWDNIYSGKNKIIDDYIVAVTYVYYAIATGIQLPSSFSNDPFVQQALAKEDAIKSFKVTNGANSSSSVDQQCADTSGSAGGGNIVTTALGLAWPNRKHVNDPGMASATSAYQKAMPVAEGTNSPASDMWSDCGVFVATVMRTSGADPTYQRRNTPDQYAYLKRSGKYNIYTDASNASQLKPGDILIIPDQHTYIFTGSYKGDDNKSYNGTSASLNGHVPIAQVTYFDLGPEHFYVAHLKSDDTARPGLNKL